MRAETLARLREFGFKTYDAYMASDLWATNKSRANLIQSCWVCGTNTYLQVHHCSYEHVCDEKPGDLIVLCGGHHQAVHRVVRRGLPLLSAHIKYKEDPELADLKIKKSKVKKIKSSNRDLTPSQRERKRKRKLVHEENNRLSRLSMTKMERKIALNDLRRSIGLPEHDLITNKQIRSIGYVKEPRSTNNYVVSKKSLRHMKTKHWVEDNAIPQESVDLDDEFDTHMSRIS